MPSGPRGQDNVITKDRHSASGDSYLLNKMFDSAGVRRTRRRPDSQKAQVHPKGTEASYPEMANPSKQHSQVGDQSTDADLPTNSKLCHNTEQLSEACDKSISKPAKNCESPQHLRTLDAIGRSLGPDPLPSHLRVSSHTDGDNLSETGTYTIDHDNPEEVKARESIDQVHPHLILYIP